MSRTVKLLFAFALLFLVLRWIRPGETTYTLDEPYQQLTIDSHLAAGNIPLSNSRGSSIPVPYGPGVLWFWMLVRLFTWNPIAIVLENLALQTLGFLLFAQTFRRAFGNEAAAWCVALAACSPLLFLFARHPWDPTFLIPLSAILIWLLQKLDDGGRELPLHAALGFVGGYGVNTHLMFGAVFLALGLTLLIRDARLHGWRAWRPLAVFSFSALAILTPYLIDAARIVAAENSLAMEHARVKHHWGDLRNVWWLFLRTTLFSSLYGSRIHLEEAGVRQQLEHFVGPFTAFFFRVDLFGWFGKLAAWGSAGAVLVRLARGRFDDKLLRVFAALAFVSTILVYNFLNIPTAPHYFSPIWWFVFVGIAGAITHLHGWWKRTFLFTLAASIVVNSAFDMAALAFIHKNRGARNGEMRVVLEDQLKMFREVCTWAQGRGLSKVRVDANKAFIADPPFQFIPAHMPECHGLTFELVYASNPADVRLSVPKDSDTSAALVISY